VRLAVRAEGGLERGAWSAALEAPASERASARRLELAVDEG
jgi:hypothetical protein